MAKLINKILKLFVVLTVMMYAKIDAQLYPIDSSAYHTNFSISASNTYIWIAGLAVNKAYTAVCSNALTQGDDLPTFRLKQGSNNIILLNMIVNNANWISNNAVLINPLISVLNTNVWGSPTNYLGVVNGIWSVSLTSITNYDLPELYWKSSIITTSDIPNTSLYQLTNSQSPQSLEGVSLGATALATTSSSGYVALYGGIGQFGNPISLVVNSNVIYTGISQQGLTIIGPVTNITNWSFIMTTNYDPSTLYASALGDAVSINFTNGTTVGDFLSIFSNQTNTFNFTNTPTIGTDVFTNADPATAAYNFAYQAASYYPYVNISGTTVTIQGLSPTFAITNSGFATVSATPASFWQVPLGYQTTNQLYIELQDSAGTNAGGLQSITVYDTLHPSLIGNLYQLHGEDLLIRNLKLEGNLYGAIANQVASNTLAITVIQNSLAPILSLFTNGYSTNFQIVTPTSTNTIDISSNTIQNITSP